MDNALRKLPILPLRGMMVFPYMIVHLDAGREASVAALNQAMLGDKQILLVAQRDGDVEEPSLEDLYNIGTVAEVKQLVKLPGGIIRVLVEGLHRGQIVNFFYENDYMEADIREYIDEISENLELEALVRVVAHEFEQWVKSSNKIPAEAIVSVSIISDAGRLADMVASHINLKLEDRQDLLECIDIRQRLEHLFGFLKRERDILEIEKKIGNRVKKQVEKIQKEYYLREKIKAIHKELGDNDGIRGDIEEYKKRLKEGKYPENVIKTVKKELIRLERTQGIASQEAGVISSYIDNLLELPWEAVSEDIEDIKFAAEILDKDHYGLKKVKDRILEFMSVRQLTKGMNAPILCLAGPPGVGKTSLAASVARALGRKFVRASLGGVRDEAEIRGHRRTYVGSMPGRILEALKKAGTRNPVFLLDEIDKMGSDYHGDPASAMLEVLDPAQNNTFSDHYVELPFDLSKVLWIVTANDLGNIPRPLLDRMEIISLSSYTEEEKVEIAKRYLLPRQKEKNGLTGKEIRVGAGVLQRIINEYTREAGVRELERVLGHLCRKVGRKIVEGEVKSQSITVKNLEDVLGKVKYPHRKATREASIGLCTGMAWTQSGGDILPTEVNVFPGKGNLILTGKLGDVMKESAQAALSYIRSRQEKLGLAEDFYEKNDIHIHFPEGAIPKDGPSAGITMATAMVSALTGQKVKSDVAMTGEITIRGNVLAIGGLKEKVLAAYREGMKTIVLPKENSRDIEDIPQSIRENLTFVPAEHMDEVLAVALLK